jgi:O-antigen/teichoic acid export membrane protein
MSDDRTPATGRDADDLSGRSRMAWNVVASWLGHSVFVVAGFFLPRIIDRHLGQTGLGIWDFGWSLVSYLGIAQVGVGSSVNRFVAKRRAEHDTTGLNRTVSSVMFLQGLIALGVIVLTAGGTWMVPALLSAQLGGFVSDARMVVFLLGLGVTVQMALNPYVGVLTGCHRWDLHNAISGSMYGVTAIGMAATVMLGGGLPALAAVNLTGTLLSEIIRAVAAHRVCPELRIRWSSVSLAEAKTLLSFGGKTVVGVLSGLLLYQTNALQIVGHLGAASLALYSRPMSLVRHVRTFANKFAMVLIPTASSLHAAGRTDELRALLEQGCRASLCLGLPPMLVLAIMGDPILRLWMGAHYAAGALVAVLAIGHLADIVKQPVWSILVGTDMHGRAAALSLCGSTVSVALCATALGPLQGGLVSAALSLALPITLADGFGTTFYACRRLKVPFGPFLAHVWRLPILCVLPFAACLLGARVAFPDRPALSLAAGLLSGGPLLAGTYWRWVIPESIKKRTREILLGAVTRVRRLAWAG